MSSISKHFEKVVSSLSIVGGFVLPLRKPSLVVERFLRFEGTLEDWRTACRRFDVHFDEWRSYPEQLKEHFKPGLNNALGAEQKEFLTQWGTLTADIRFDIHCFYIFSKIPFVSFGAVLFAMAENWSEGWQSATKLIKALKRDSSPTVFRDFNARFDSDLRWFEDHINLYRNKFIEHPFPVALPGAIVSDDKGARLAGLTGRGISKEDESLISEIEAAGSDAFSGLSDLPLMQRYLEICRRLHEVPETHRRRAESMILRVGLESGELEPLAARLAEIFAGFISFFAEWKNRNLPDVETVADEVSIRHP